MYNDQGILLNLPVVLKEMGASSKLVYKCKIWIIIPWIKIKVSYIICVCNFFAQCQVWLSYEVLFSTNSQMSFKMFSLQSSLVEWILIRTSSITILVLQENADNCRGHCTCLKKSKAQAMRLNASPFGTWLLFPLFSFLFFSHERSDVKRWD